jgi:hypothetical protein
MLKRHFLDLVSERWVRKMLKRVKERGDAVVVHGLRGRASWRCSVPETATGRCGNA